MNRSLTILSKVRPVAQELLRTLAPATELKLEDRFATGLAVLP